ncbi:enoyl-CoA hydratase/isomerase family protein [Sphingobium yanoikuyae]|uniref:Enoyl-CoA hydratase/isomerase family protein n=1 Tax=Sphingobium yanoikuyae TaxID=13690 RepID=A0A430C8Y7_SPHYA|nr:enoyl-CoA hydratase/isomerase family protein [Sphingobium yanoikuyae]RSU61381.1 enoyl-CoA hydratase/isomerase family protein [Sphingobium yanoikuyae]
MGWQHIHFGITTSVARVTLACPEKRNVLSRALLAEIGEALDAVEKEGVRLLILDAEGKAFSSGGDLADPMTHAGELGSLLDDHYHPLLRRLADLPCPTISVVDGLIVGGACGLALACDMVVATERARFAFPFTQIGLIPDCGLNWMLPRIVGPVQAKRMLLFGETIDGEEAFRIGMASRFVESGVLDSFLSSIIDTALALDPQAIAGAKQAAALAETQTLEQALATERELQHRAGQSPRFAATLARLSNR